MNKKWSLLCILVITLLVSGSSVLAISSPLILDSQVEDAEIKSNETAKYTIYIENTQDTSDTITIDHDFLKWQVTAKPYSLDIPPQTTRKSKVTISPPLDIEEGSYSLTLNFQSKDNPDLAKRHTLVVSITENVGAKPVEASLNFPSGSAPGETEFSVNVKNRLGRSLTNLKLLLDSPLLSETYEKEFGIGGKEEKVVNGKLELPAKSPGEYELTFLVNQGEKTILSETKRVELLKGGKVDIGKRTEEGFLKSTHKITIENKKNEKVKRELKTVLGSFEKYFVNSKPKPTATKKVEGGEEFFWIYSLEPGESTTITYTISYQGLFAIIVVLIVIGFAAYLYLREEVKVSKKVLLTKTKEDKKYIKIMIQIKNNSRKTLRHLKLRDKIKPPLNLIEKFDTLKPSLIKKKKKEIKLTWDIDTLGPKEEKVIAYGTKSKLKVLGKLQLPKAIVSYKKDGKKRKFWSNSPSIRSKKE